LPGSGWVEFDPTNGIVGNRDLIRVAVARDARQVIPLHGSYFGNVEEGRRGHDRASRREREQLQHQRRAVDYLAPAA
jgi:transglutaminase-like putative cysteine protease